MARLFGLCLIFITVLASCSKEENIPFINEDRDTITPTSFIDLSGKYRGILQHIEFINDSAYIIISSQEHTISVDEIDYTTIIINNITNFSSVNAETIISREIGGAYMQMLDSKLPPTVGTLPAFKVDLDSYNGIYLFTEPKEIQYFIYITDMIDTTQQVFNGTFIE